MALSEKLIKKIFKEGYEEHGVAIGMGIAIWFLIWLYKNSELDDPRELIDHSVKDFEANVELAFKPYRKESEH